MSQRFFVSTPITQDTILLGGDEGHHLARVMRAKPGDRIVLFDGGGAEYVACVLSVGRDAVELQVLQRREANRESRRFVVLGVALPKGDRQRFLVEKAVELGWPAWFPLKHGGESPSPPPAPSRGLNAQWSRLPSSAGVIGSWRLQRRLKLRNSLPQRPRQRFACWLIPVENRWLA